MICWLRGLVRLALALPRLKANQAETARNLPQRTARIYADLKKAIEAKKNRCAS
jgi:hypothetical protein